LWPPRFPNTASIMPKNNIVKHRTEKEIRESIINSCSGFDANYILKLGDEEIRNLKGPKKFSGDSNYYKAMTLCEFDKGVLLLNSVSDLYQVFALDFCRNLQKEFNCINPSEKSLAEVTALNFVRVLAIQRKIKYVSDSVKTRYDMQYLAVLSKELDRAERHYLTSLQALKMLKNPPMEVNIKTQTAVVGQNQIVQANNKQNSNDS